MTEEFAKVNPFQRVPVINDDGFQLTERLVQQFGCVVFVVIMFSTSREKNLN